MDSPEQYSDDSDGIDDEIITSDDENENEESNQMEESINNQPSTNGTDKNKAEALKQQIALWDSFLELRIKLQKATITCNCLPTTTIADDEELNEVIDENATLFRKTLALLLAIEKHRSKKRKHPDDIDEHDDNLEQYDRSQTINDIFKTISKRMKQDEHVLEEEMNATYAQFIPIRDSVVQKWYERTRGFVKQNKTAIIDQSPVVQIKEIMSFPDRLIKRTQTSRIDYDLICPPSSPNTNENGNETKSMLNPDLFDDGDFYHQLLREYIERKTASITDPDQISRHWAQLRKLRNKLKKNVDTKASKDRKIRYNIHKKLVNYMAPIDRCSFTDEAKSDLFSSLFGANPTTNVDAQAEPPVNDIRII